MSLAIGFLREVTYTALRRQSPISRSKISPESFPALSPGRSEVRLIPTPRNPSIEDESERNGAIRIR